VHGPGADIEYIKGFPSKVAAEKWPASQDGQAWREMRGYPNLPSSGARPFTRAGVLRSMSAASTFDQQRFAAKTFRLWAEAEGLLLEK
jgi:hypothetical protein